MMLSGSNSGKTLQQIADELGYKSRSAYLVRKTVNTFTYIQNPMYCMYVNVLNKYQYEYRYQLERYRGRGTRYNCPQCDRKYMSMRE